MKKLFNMAVAILVSVTGLSQNNTDYNREVKAFLSFIRSTEIKTEHFVITSQPENRELAACNALWRDTAVIKPSDKLTFSRDSGLLLKKWTPDLLSPAVVIEQDTVAALFKDYKARGWSYYHATYAPGLYRISSPLFLKDYTQCLLYIGYACDNSCGEGVIKLYEKTGGQWKAYRSFCIWTK